eukprot:CAMPEP_0119039548 /NCGR_PEP_ID=MMETSP1177-20130426/9102_1 /TAXON_ID=2985 /ORGANISM="Ochromonas sp, Strain CCMP1899" /LENGTH=658 /DNA_ID=CAMNT_0007003575 /DNA_START=256 /DNA_END=2232 /DNA_ORIENTATION=+
MMKSEGSVGSAPSTMIKYDPSRGSYASSHYKKKIDAQWSSASSNDPFRTLPPMTKEDKMRAMLGHKLPSGKSNPIFWREDYCGACGFQHRNPALLDTYPTCEKCQNTLRQASNLSKRYERLDPLSPLEILFASYGDSITENEAVDVTQKVKYIMIKKGEDDRLSFGAHCNFYKLFGFDPSVNKPKQLRVRYRMGGIFGTIVIGTNINSRMTSSNAIVLSARSYASPNSSPSGGKNSRMVTISRAHFGHPKGISSTGRMSYDVTEIVQGLLDLGGGSHFVLAGTDRMGPLFGDPCPGYPKELRVEFEILGRSYTEVRTDNYGHLSKALFVESSPIISPTIFVVNAWYGMTTTGRNERLLTINKILTKIEQTDKKINKGEIVTNIDRSILSSKKSLLSEKILLRNSPLKCIDISDKIQSLLGKGGMSLFFDKNNFDPDRHFGNPYSDPHNPYSDPHNPSLGESVGSQSSCSVEPSGFYNINSITDTIVTQDNSTIKLLSVTLVSQGHDAERLTSSIETTSAGDPLNFISGKNAHYLITVMDKGDSVDRLNEDLSFYAETATPIININKASYGNFDNMSQLTDATTELQMMVKNRALNFKTAFNLSEIFSTDPCPGLQKQLKVNYSVLGFQGRLRIRCDLESDCLVGGLELGYTPINPPDI